MGPLLHILLFIAIRNLNYSWLKTLLHPIGGEHFQKNFIIARGHRYNLKTNIIQIRVYRIHTAPSCACGKSNVTLIGYLTCLINTKPIIPVDREGFSAIQFKSTRANI